MKIKDIAVAVELYYAKTELSTGDIANIFDCARSTAVRLKKRALELQIERDVLTFSAQCVDTECAYDAWGIDVADLERRLDKLYRLRKKLHPDQEQNQVGT